MEATRRSFLISGAGAFAACRSAAAEGLQIQPLSPTSGKSSLYARMANVGPAGIPEGSNVVRLSKDTKIDVWLPPGALAARIIIFSHGELGIPAVYSRLLSHWSSHGFAVIAPIHDDSMLQNGIRAMQRNSQGDETWDINSVINDPKSWASRVEAIKTTLDALPLIEQALRVRLLDDRPIICGHSLGAYTAQMMLGAKAMGADGKDSSSLDTRLYAGILMSPQGRGVLGLHDGSWDNMKRPFMVVTGNGDIGTIGQDPNVKLEPFSLSPPGNKHLAWLSKVKPTLFSGQLAPPGSNEEIVFGDLLSITTGFLSAYGTYEPEVFAELAGDYFEKASNGRIMMRYR